MNAIKRLINTVYHWATQIPYDEGWDDGVNIGYELAKREAEYTATVKERRRVRTFLKRERSRLLELEKLQWKGYNSELVEEIDILLVLLGKDDELWEDAKEKRSGS